MTGVTHMTSRGPCELRAMILKADQIPERDPKGRIVICPPFCPLPHLLDSTEDGSSSSSSQRLPTAQLEVLQAVCPDLNFLSEPEQNGRLNPQLPPHPLCSGSMTFVLKCTEKRQVFNYSPSCGVKSGRGEATLSRKGGEGRMMPEVTRGALRQSSARTPRRPGRAAVRRPRPQTPLPPSGSSPPSRLSGPEARNRASLRPSQWPLRKGRRPRKPPAPERLSSWARGGDSARAPPSRLPGLASLAGWAARAAASAQPAGRSLLGAPGCPGGLDVPGSPTPAEAPPRLLLRRLPSTAALGLAVAACIATAVFPCKEGPGPGGALAQTRAEESPSAALLAQSRPRRDQAGSLPGRRRRRQGPGGPSDPAPAESPEGAKDRPAGQGWRRSWRAPRGGGGVRGGSAPHRKGGGAGGLRTPRSLPKDRELLQPKGEMAKGQPQGWFWGKATGIVAHYQQLRVPLGSFTPQQATPLMAHEQVWQELSQAFEVQPTLASLRYDESFRMRVAATCPSDALPRTSPPSPTRTGALPGSAASQAESAPRLPTPQRRFRLENLRRHPREPLAGRAREEPSVRAGQEKEGNVSAAPPKAPAPVRGAGSVRSPPATALACGGSACSVPATGAARTAPSASLPGRPRAPAGQGADAGPSCPGERPRGCGRRGARNPDGRAAAAASQPAPAGSPSVEGEQASGGPAVLREPPPLARPPAHPPLCSHSHRRVRGKPNDAMTSMQVSSGLDGGAAPPRAASPPPAAQGCRARLLRRREASWDGRERPAAGRGRAAAAGCRETPSPTEAEGTCPVGLAWLWRSEKGGRGCALSRLVSWEPPGDASRPLLGVVEMEAAASPTVGKGSAPQLPERGWVGEERVASLRIPETSPFPPTGSVSEKGLLEEAPSRERARRWLQLQPRSSRRARGESLVGGWGGRRLWRGTRRTRPGPGGAAECPSSLPESRAAAVPHRRRLPVSASSPPRPAESVPLPAGAAGAAAAAASLRVAAPAGAWFQHHEPRTAPGSRAEGVALPAGPPTSRSGERPLITWSLAAGAAGQTSFLDALERHQTPRACPVQSQKQPPVPGGPGPVGGGGLPSPWAAARFF
ncbi:collagen alpha-1(I) chain-like [Elgaria multicarinata webbii]|uniref:collagen alpha-1(I) chain-like n=1 Tax=Elgaria multicarinata webbii TaxID=159646 RepID=UPI002FCD1477